MSLFYIYNTRSVDSNLHLIFVYIENISGMVDLLTMNGYTVLLAIQSRLARPKIVLPWQIIDMHNNVVSLTLKIKLWVTLKTQFISQQGYWNPAFLFILTDILLVIRTNILRRNKQIIIRHNYEELIFSMIGTQPVASWAATTYVIIWYLLVYNSTYDDEPVWKVMNSKYMSWSNCWAHE